MRVMCYVELSKGFVWCWSSQAGSREVGLNVTLPREVGACVGEKKPASSGDDGEIGGREKG